MVAPSARRTPKSRTRCWTEYARMPNTPTIASTSASPANVITITARNRWRAVASHATSSSVITSLTLTSCSLSTRPIAARTDGASASARPDAGRTTQIDVVHQVLRHRHVDLHEIRRFRRAGPSPDGRRRRSPASTGVACGDVDRPSGDPQADRRSALQVAADERFVHDADRDAVARDRDRRSRGRRRSADRASGSTSGLTIW